MKFYLSSFKLGNNPQRLTQMLGGNRLVAVIANSKDFENSDVRVEKVQGEIDSLKQIGIQSEEIDLRKYFGKKEELARVIIKYDGVWVRGGNVFLLKEAYDKSGFGEIIKDMHQNGRRDFVYGGYSAGCCILSLSLDGLQLVDDPNLKVEGYEGNLTDLNGLGLIDFCYIPHYQSNHPESESINSVVEYCKNKGIKFQTFSDGEVLIF